MNPVSESAFLRAKQMLTVTIEFCSWLAETQGALAQQVLADAAPTGEDRVVAVAADLSADWPTELLKCGFDAKATTVWVIEGLLMNLPQAEASSLMDATRELSHPYSALFADLAHPHIDHNELFSAGRRTLQDNDSPIRSRVADPIKWFAVHGWVSRVVDPVALATQYGRNVPAALDQRLVDGPTFWFTESRINKAAQI